MTRDQIFPQPDFLRVVNDDEYFAGRRAAVTGHSGVLGRILTRRLLGAGARVGSYRGDVTDGAAVDEWLAEVEPELIFHLAAVVPVSVVDAAPVRAYYVNTVGALNVAAAAIKHAPTSWAFYASSSHVYEPLPVASTSKLSEDSPTVPRGLYGASKLAAEQLIEPILDHAGVDWCIGRIFSFSHKTQRPPYLVPQVLEQLSMATDGSELTVNTPDAVRDFLDAESVVDAILLLAQRHHEGIVNVGSGVGITVGDLVEYLASHHGLRVVVRRRSESAGNRLVANVSKLRDALGEPAR